MDSLKFGTSGLRGLVADLVGGPAYAYSAAFLRYLSKTPASGSERTVLIGRDLRASSPGIAADCIAAAAASGFRAVDCGALPTPALALAGIARRCPAIMVTGSHIPDDRNGLKFYRADGEITKDDEAGILAAFAERRGDDRPEGAPVQASAPDGAASAAYKRRYLDFFEPDALRGLRVGVYQQSSVARDLLVEVLDGLGAATVPLARSEAFIPVDTEAHREEDKDLIAGWAASGDYDAIVSTDGDADRPLIADADGRILRGDIAGLLTAAHLRLETIVTPVTSGSALEASGVASSVIRTRVGSPFVIAGMAEAAAGGKRGIVGFEANGGVLLGSAVRRDGKVLDALPTRDALLPILCVLAEAAARKVPVGMLVENLKPGHALAHRLQQVASESSGRFLARIAEDESFRTGFFATVGAVRDVDRLDGVRVVLADGATVHYRASGNAPELRCYVEAPSEGEAKRLLDWGLGAAERALAG